MNRQRAIALACILAAAPFAAHADDDDDDSKTSLFAYGWGSFIQGDVELGYSDEISVGVAPGDIVDSIEFAAAMLLRHEWEKVVLDLDLNYVGLGATKGPISYDSDQVFVGADIGYRITKHEDILIGARYTRFDISLELDDPFRFDESRDQDWVDVMVGFQSVRKFAKHWKYQFRADVGGFGLGADITWQAMAHVGYVPKDSLSIWLGYRALGFNYEDGDKRDYRSFDLTYHGPEVGLGLHF